MMQGKTIKEEEGDNPEPKRSIRDVDDDGKERVKLAIQEQVQALTQLVEDRMADVQKAEEEVRKAELQLAKARKRLSDAEAHLGRTQGHLLPITPSVKVKTEQGTPSRDSNEKETGTVNKPPLAIPGSNGYSNLSAKSGMSKRLLEPSSSPAHSEGVSNITKKMKNAKNEGSSGASVEKRPVKKRPEPKESVNLVPSIRGSSSPALLRMIQPTYFSSQHKRKLRSLAVNPTSEQICATSALDGVVNIWQIQGRGIGLNILSSVDCLSPKQRRWPEDMVWHPSGDCLFACYSADGGDSQVAVIDSSAKVKAKFLEDKPHVKGIVNSIVFLPWGDNSFVTGGSDHAVVLWEEKDTNEGLKWKAKALHRNQHSSAVMGVAGLQQKEMVISCGADKRVVGHDIRYNRSNICYTLESKAMGVLPNPADFNLFMVQTGTPGEQLHLYDIRVHRTELHVFGWKQDSSESQSALINQTWSPDGYYIASGSADPKVHIFDIRYNSKEASQSIRAHQKRVFKAAWHHSLPLLISISSDLNIGLLRYNL